MSDWCCCSFFHFHFCEACFVIAMPTTMQRKPSSANHNKAGIRICRSWISQQSINIFLIFPERSTSCFLFEKRKKITRQWSHVKTFEFVCFYCLTSIYFYFFYFLFCFCKTNFDVFIIFSELSVLKGNVLFMEIYTPIKSSILSLTKFAIFM